MSSSILQETYALVQKDFELPATPEVVDEYDAIAMLSKVIAYMLDRDFEKLLQVCYRIDLGEDKLKHILHLSEPDKVSSDLANALWERQKQKIEIRRRYAG